MVIHEIYTITLFIKGVVADVKIHDADREKILAKVEHEHLSLETFKVLFFDDEGALMANKRLPGSFKHDVATTLLKLKHCPLEYGLEAA